MYATRDRFVQCSFLQIFESDSEPDDCDWDTDDADEEPQSQGDMYHVVPFTEAVRSGIEPAKLFMVQKDREDDGPLSMSQVSKTLWNDGGPSRQWLFLTVMFPEGSYGV